MAGHEAVCELEVTDPALDDDWPSLWLRYARSLPGIAPPPSAASRDQRELQQEWIDDAVQAFCRTRHARARLEAAVAKELD
jgi:hypothetical protein